MASLTSVSSSELAQRRQQLRQRRSSRLLKNSWQLLVTGSLLGGLFWLVSLPIWVIRSSQQVTIQGNKSLATSTLKALLPLSYPKSLLEISPYQIAQTLETQSPIVSATVNRHLWPLGITISVVERPPIAVTIPGPSLSRLQAQNLALRSPSSMGVLDASGVWMPLEAYQNPNQVSGIPKLKIVGMREQYRPYWTALYESIHQSPVKIWSIDWQDPTNLILKTELGTVHLGTYGPQLSQQLRTLDQMRKLPTHVDQQTIAYIDLTSPTAPALNIKNSKKAANP
jgi:cell division protein FtsQ